MVSSDSTKVKIQSFGRFLSNMVMPNIGAFIAWGFITALFIPTGWFPNDQLGKMVGPMITYLLPILIGLSGGKMVGGDRGAVVGAITTMGVIVGTDIPMFMGAMIAGPVGGWAIKRFDRAMEGKVKSGFEMLINNFSVGIIGMILALLAFFMIGPFVEFASQLLAKGVNALVQANLLPLTSIFVEPAKILFLNNAINHGIFSPLGIQRATEIGQSIFFLIEANPGPGLGVLLAYALFNKGAVGKSAAGASIIHFFGGIHEIYFPYVLMKPRLIIALIAGGMTGVFTLTLFNAGLVAPASPGSVFAILLMTPKSSTLGVVCSILASGAVSFFISSIIVKASQTNDVSLEEAEIQMQSMKQPGLMDLGEVNSILVACDAGMGSSAMGASLLRKKVEGAGLPVTVSNCAINSLDETAQLVLTHQDLTSRAKKVAPKARHISLINFVDSAFYNNLVEQLTQARQESGLLHANHEDIDLSEPVPVPVPYTLSVDDIFLGCTEIDKFDTIRFTGHHLVKSGCVEPEYIDAMIERENIVHTYLGEFIATPHGTERAKDSVLKTGIVFCQYPQGIQFGDEKDEVARIVIAIAARNNEHIGVISAITNALDDRSVIEELSTTKDPQKVLELLGYKS